VISNQRVQFDGRNFLLYGCFVKRRMNEAAP
jgi:hypothetical protein